MAYEVIADHAVTIPKALGVLKDRSGNEYEEVESFTYFPGEVLNDEDVSPHVQQLVKDGDERIGKMLKHVSGKADAGRSVAAHDKALEAEYEHASTNAGLTTAGGDQAPYLDYADLPEREILRRLKTLTAAQVERVKRYEREHGLNRPGIAKFEVKDASKHDLEGKPAPGVPSPPQASHGADKQASSGGSSSSAKENK